MPGLISNSPTKKRKPDGDLEARAVKRTAQDAGSANVRVSVLRNEEELCPVVGLSISKNIPLDAYKKQTGTAPYELLLQSSAHPRLDYEAHQDYNGPDSHLQHYVGMYDAATGDLKLLEARHLTMRTTLRPEESSEDESEEGARITNAAKRFDLTTAFGTKKAKKAISSLSTNAIVQSKGGDAAEAALLESVAATSGKAFTRDALQSAVDEAKPRPLANMTTAEVRDVYPLASLIGAEEMHKVPIQDWKKQKGAVSVHSRFVANKLPNIATAAIADDDLARDKIIALRYLYILTELYAAGKTGRRGGKRLPKREILQEKLGIDGALLNSVMRRFGADGELTKWNVDFLITHVCALALIAGDFRVDTCDIRKDLALKDKEMLQYFREIGCIVTAPTEPDLAKAYHGNPPPKDAALHHRIAKLRLPLQFPKQRAIVRKRR